ncbi:MAG: InlB B-repeat-containing protein [Treponema sp.]|nr:InlB B-repeat-containing protein [Treponema sp.]
MKNSSARLLFGITVLLAVCALFTSCSNAIMETWWDKPEGKRPNLPVYHTVVFQADGGLPAPGIQNIAHDGKIAKILAMTKEHYAFAGWYEKDTRGAFAEEWDFAKDIVKKDTTLFAKWQPISDVIITFEANGGNPPPPPQSLVKDTLVVMPQPMSRPGFGFGGWYTEPECIHRWNFSFVAAGNHTLYAKWESNPALIYTVVFDAGSGSPPPIDQQIAYGGTAVEPIPMTWAGHSFGGWYSDAALTESWNFSGNTVTGNTTLYARWEAHFYTITFAANGGSPAPENQRIAVNQRIVEPPQMSRNGDGFGGWYKDPALTVPWVFIDDVDDGIDLIDTVDQDLTLYAKWDTPHYLVTFQSNSGYPVPESQTLNHGARVVEPVPMTRNDGHGFGGWFEDDAFTTPWSFSAPVTGDITLHAKWDTPRYLITFAAEGGTPAPAPQNLVELGRVVEPPPMSRPGHGFAGWYIGSVDGARYDFGIGQATSNITLYAKWVTYEYIVIFDARGGTPAPEDQRVIYDSLVTRPVAMIQPSMSFGGWFTDEACSGGNEWDFSTPVTTERLSENGIIRLYAMWAQLPAIYTVTFDANGGNPAPAPQSVVENSRIFEPSAMRRAVSAGSNLWFGFGGWFTENGIEWDFSAGRVNANITLTAKWEEPHCQVTFEAYDGNPAPRTQDLVSGTRIVEPLSMSKPGYGFGGWYTEPEYKNLWDFSNTVGMDDIILHARWVTNFYTVEFRTNGGSPAPVNQTIAHGNLLTLPPPMKKAGEGFMGWYKDETGTAENEWKFAEDRVEREGIILYAKWGQALYIVKFNLKLPDGTTSSVGNSGHGITAPADQNISPGGKIIEPLPGNIFGWSFYGWTYFDEPSYNQNPHQNRQHLVDWDFDRPVNEDDEDINRIVIYNDTTKEHVITLYARWVPNEPDMVWVRKGSFMMGAAGSGTSPVHNVKLGTGFYMAKYLVTQDNYHDVMSDLAIYDNNIDGPASTTGGPGSSTPSQFKAGQPLRPVDRVSWYDGVAYSNWRTIKENNTTPGLNLIPAYSLNGETNPANWGIRPAASPSTWDSIVLNQKANGYRLPTEAEWEYAARGGYGSPGNFNYAGSNNAEDVAWYNTNSGSMTHPVGTKLPNGLGIYDMNGNIMEWCWDWFSSSYYSESNNNMDPTGPLFGIERVRRGGSWNNAIGNIRTVSRSSFPPHNDTWVMGFRVIRGYAEIY